MITSFHVRIYRPGLWLLALVGLSAVLLSIWMAGCAKKPTETPIPELAPETSISAITVRGEKTTVYAKGTDSDGVIAGYRFRVDGGPWTEWQKGSVYEFPMIYGSMDEAHTIEAMARDSDQLEDPTPAKLTYTPARIGTYNRTPDTFIKTPPAGARTSGAVILAWDGLDPDGSIQGYEYSLDGSGWSRVGADTKSLLQTGLADGGHTFMVRTVDNLGVPDPIPASVSFFVQPGFAPELEITEGPSDGATFFVPEGATSDFSLGWDASVDYYYGSIQGYSYKFPAGGINDWMPVSEELTSATLASLGASDTPYEVYVKAVDRAGNETEKKISFSIVTPTMDKGILLVNGVDWGTYSDGPASEATGDPWEMYEGRAVFGNHAVTFWDAFSTGPSGGYPTTLGDPIGTGPLDGATLGQYSTLIWVANGYNGDDDVWNASVSLIKSYLNAGGNVLLATRYGFAIGFLDQDLMTYAHITEAGNIQTVTASDPLIAKVDGLVNMIPGNGEEAVSATETCFVEDNPEVTVLFEYGSTGEVAGLLVEPEGKGTFAYIAGRPYRYDIATSAANYDYILTHFFGEP